MSILGAAEAHRHHTKLLLREALQIELARSPSGKHLRKAIRLKIAQEDRWREGLTAVSDHWEDILTKHALDTAIIYAQSEWRLLVPEVTKADTPPPSSPNADEVKQRLTSSLSGQLAVQGAMQMYLGLAGETARVSGQQALEHMGLNKTFAFAHPQNMARDLFQVRGSKVMQAMYGNHVDALSKLIVKATDPRNPMTLGEVKASIREQWPGMRAYQVDRIARTETATVWTATSVNAYSANGISEFNSSIAEGPTIGIDSDDPCDECVDAAAEGPFSIDSDDLPPWHPNCRCEAIPVLEDSETGDQWLPPDEPWSGGAEGADLPVEEAPLNSVGGVDESWSPNGTVQPADEPISSPELVADAARQEELAASAANLGTDDAARAVQSTIDQWNPGYARKRLHVISDATGQVRAAMLSTEDGSYVNLLGSTLKGGGTELIRTAARTAKEANVGIELVPTTVGGVSPIPFYEKLGFVDTGTGTMRLEGDALNRLAAKSGEAGAAVAAPPVIATEATIAEQATAGIDALPAEDRRSLKVKGVQQIDALEKAGLLDNAESIEVLGSYNQVGGIGAPNDLDMLITVKNPTEAQRHARASDTAKRIRSSVVLGGKYREYLMRPQELWARAYSQFIAEETQSANLLRGLESAANSGTYQTWPAEEFKPIGEAVRAVLKERGLIGATPAGPTTAVSSQGLALHNFELKIVGTEERLLHNGKSVVKIFNGKRFEINQKSLDLLPEDLKAAYVPGTKGYYNLAEKDPTARAKIAQSTIDQLAGLLKKERAPLPDPHLRNPARSPQHPEHTGPGPQELRARELLRRARPAASQSSQTSKSSVSHRQTRGRIGSVQAERIAKLRRKARA